MKRLSVWWVPQVPMKSFRVEVSSVQEGVKILEVLADYDNFQVDNNVKPDCCNAGGLQQWDNDCDELGNPGWIDWWDEATDETDPFEYVTNRTAA